MGSRPKITLEKTRVSQTIDLQKEFGIDFSTRPDLALQLGQEFIDRIRDRTEDENRSIDGKPLKKYNKDYIDSDEFKDFGKSARDVNMTLTGRMMDDMDVLDLSGNQITIGFVDSTETAKAYNHNVGDTLPKRAFFGVNGKEISNIKKKYKSDIDEINNQNIDRAAIFSQIVGLTAREQFDDIFDELFGL